MITLYSKCDQASDLWQQLELASELESDLRGTVDWGNKWLLGKTQLVSFDRSNNTGAIDVKMDGSVLKEKSSFKGLLSGLKQLLATESLLKMMKNAFYFTFLFNRKAIFILKIFKFLS